MQPTAPRTLSTLERHLDGLRDHPVLGRPVGFYFRRREQLLYLVVGGWNTLFGYCVWALMQFLLGDYLPYLVIVLLAWPIAVLNAYLGYRYIVFRSRGPVLRELPRFSLVYASTLVVNLAVLPIALAVLPFNIYVVQALFTVVVVVCSYLAHKYYSFRGGRAGTRRPIPLRSHCRTQGLTGAQRPKGTAVPLLTILTPCYNEEGNVREVYQQVKAVMQTLPGYDYEHLFIDNASKDGTVAILRELAAADKRVKVIVNTRNFGQVRSPYHAFLQARGDAVMSCVADLQDPPELIPQFVRKWEEGYKVVIGVKQGSRESWLMARTRRLYYWFVGKLSSDVELVHNFTGFGLYDREVVEQFRGTDEQYPYFRGLVCRFRVRAGRDRLRAAARTRGKTSNNFFSLYDIAMLGITNHSKVPLRIATMAGFSLSILSLVIALVYLVLKLAWWDTFNLGLAPLVIGVYFFGAVQLFFIGVLGEYIGSIHTQVHKRPLVVEKERINFD